MEQVLIGIKAVTQLTGLTRSRIYEFVNEPETKFPAPLKIGRSTRWYFDEVQAWAMQLRQRTQSEVPVRTMIRKPAARVVARVSEYDFAIGEDGVVTAVLRSTRLLTSSRPPEWKPEVLHRTIGRRAAVGDEGSASARAPLPAPASSQGHPPPNFAEIRLQYEAGATLDQLTTAHRIGKARLLRLLREAGTLIRPPGPRRRNPHRWPSLGQPSSSAGDMHSTDSVPRAVASNGFAGVSSS